VAQSDQMESVSQEHPDMSTPIFCLVKFPVAEGAKTTDNSAKVRAPDQLRGPSTGLAYRAGRLLWRAYRHALAPTMRQLFLTDLITETGNFGETTWLGQPIWQNALDLQIMQETIYEVKPELLVECGTNRGGSALFYANLFQLMGVGRVVTIDVEKMHDISHPLITFLVGSSLDPTIVDQVASIASKVAGPIMVVLDSDHSAGHVRREMETYCGLVTSGSYLLTQDGVIDELVMFRPARPGPLVAITDFLRSHHEFEVDYAKCRRFLVTHHPMGWLRRK
jgi:cephalosporin hydroxylase